MNTIKSLLCSLVLIAFATWPAQAVSPVSRKFNAADIHGQADIGSMASGDEIVLYDLSTGSAVKGTLAELLSWFQTQTFSTLDVGTLTVDVFAPPSNDGAALGTPTLSFSDLFLASGGVIGWNNGNVIITHSSGILTVAPGDLRVTTAGTNSASVLTLAGTQAPTNKDFSSSTNTVSDGMTVTHNLAAAPNQTGGWNEYYVTGSDFTTSDNGIDPVTGLTSDTLTNSAKYIFEVQLDITWSADANGTQVAISYGGSGTAATVNCLMSATNTGATNGAIQTINAVAPTASNAVGTFNTTNVATIVLRGSFQAASAGTATMIVNVKHPAAGSTTVLRGSHFFIKKPKI